jgi:aerobic-type carbon monoxide dehydrogenase small subunit (CoxS/CutS family)
MKIELQVNGARRSVTAEPGAMLLSVLREQLDLTGTKYGCGEGQCGACTVLLDGRPVRSCITRVEAATGKSITTIEGLERDGRLHPLQDAFLGAGAMQCGYCTAGMIMEGVALLRGNADPSETQVKQGLEGHICRCGTYPRIVAAVRMASKTMREARHD